ncbi:MAG: GNAT family N-acetyltransferase [Patescibacteria group bacterium]
MNTEIEFSVLDFEELTSHQLYDILELREKVFNIEQNINCPDLDGIDRNARHVLGYHNKVLVAYCRVYNMEEQTGKIGRVVVKQECRGQKLATKLVLIATKDIKAKGVSSILIRGQSHLIDLYKSCGFQVVTDPFDYEGIPHVDFRRNV